MGNKPLKLASIVLMAALPLAMGALVRMRGRRKCIKNNPLIK